jgi:hypothetical protein
VCEVSRAFLREDGDILIQLRCTAHWSKLEEDKGLGKRTREHTAYLIEYFDQATLWDDYGVIRDIAVSELPF